MVAQVFSEHGCPRMRNSSWGKAIVSSATPSLFSSKTHRPPSFVSRQETSTFSETKLWNI